MLSHKNKLILFIFCLLAMQQGTVQTATITAKTLSRTLTTILGLPEHHLSPKAFLENSTPKLIELGIQPIANTITNIMRRHLGGSARYIKNLNNEGYVHGSALILRILAFNHTHIQKDSPTRPFQETAVEAGINEILTLLQKALIHNDVRSQTNKFKATQKMRCGMLVGIDSFYTLKHLNSMRLRHSFLKRIKRSSTSKFFVASRTIPEHMIGKKYFTIQSPLGYGIRNLKDLATRGLEITKNTSGFMNPETTTPQANADSTQLKLGDVPMSALATTQTQFARSLKEIVTSKRFESMTELAISLNKPLSTRINAFNKKTPKSTLRNSSLLAANILLDMPYVPHIFILESDANLLPRTERKLLHGFMKEDYYHAISCIHKYLEPLTQPLWNARWTWTKATVTPHLNEEFAKYLNAEPIPLATAVNLPAIVQAVAQIANDVLNKPRLNDE